MIPRRLSHRISFLMLLVFALLAVQVEAGKDYYSILGVRKTANEKQIRKAYKKLALKWHPDKHKDEKSKEKATAKFHDIAEAYETLTDPEKRRIYDLGGEEGHPQGHPRGGAGTDFHPTEGSSGGIDAETLKRFFEQFGHGSPPHGHSRRGPAAAGAGAHTFHTNVGTSGGPDRDMFNGMFKQMGGSFNPGASTSAHSWQGWHGQATRSSNTRREATQTASLGGPLFSSGQIKEITFEGHDKQIQNLSQRSHLVVMFYSYGLEKCPRSCQHMKEEYEAFAQAQQAGRNFLPVFAVQCLLRKGKCGQYADHSPSVVLFGPNVRHERVLSKGVVATAKRLQDALDAALTELKIKSKAIDELRPSHFASGGDLCGGQFCLFFIGFAPSHMLVKARAALDVAVERLQRDPVKAFFVDGAAHPEFVASFGDIGRTRSSKRGLRQIPLARAILYRSARGGRYEVFEGNIEDGVALADFAIHVINRGVALRERVGSPLKMLP